MLSSINYVNLVAMVNHFMANPPAIPDVAYNDNFTVDGDEISGRKTAVIKVSGILAKGVSPDAEKLLGMVNIDFISSALDDALDDPNVMDVLIIFNSPGGSTTGVEELGRKIASTDIIKPVYGWVEQQACSSAYWLLSQCRILGMSPSASVGSVGVYAIIDDLSVSMKQAGVNKQAISAGKYKLLGANFKPLTDVERDILQTDVSKTHEQFKSVIKSKRPFVNDEALEGLSYGGDLALKFGLVDYLCDYLDEFMAEVVNKNN
jgi:protease-4